MLPQTPTAAESGFDAPGEAWFALMAPTGTPNEIIAQLQKAIADALSGGPAPDKLRGMGSEIATPEQMTPAGFAKFIRADYENMRAAAKLAGIEPK